MLKGNVSRWTHIQSAEAIANSEGLKTHKSSLSALTCSYLLMDLQFSSCFADSFCFALFSTFASFHGHSLSLPQPSLFLFVTLCISHFHSQTYTHSNAPTSYKEIKKWRRTQSVESFDEICETIHNQRGKETGETLTSGEIKGKNRADAWHMSSLLLRSWGNYQISNSTEESSLHRLSKGADEKEGEWRSPDKSCQTCFQTLQMFLPALGIPHPSSKYNLLPTPYIDKDCVGLVYSGVCGI